MDAAIIQLVPADEPTDGSASVSVDSVIESPGVDTETVLPLLRPRQRRSQTTLRKRRLRRQKAPVTWTAISANPLADDGLLDVLSLVQLP